MRGRILLVVLVGVVASVSLSLADVLMVTNTNRFGPGSFSGCIGAALPGDEIQFDPSLDGLEIPTHVTIGKDLTITGRGREETILVGYFNRVLQIGNDVSTKISGVTITGGDFDHGAGVFIGFGATVTFEDCLVTRNFSSVMGYGFAHGAGIYIAGSNVKLKGCEVSYNTASGLFCEEGFWCDIAGAGIFVWSGSLTLEDSVVRGNDASVWYMDDPVNARGGGIYSWPPLTITNSTIAGNVVIGSRVSVGGGVYGSGKIVDTTISNNFAGGCAGLSFRGEVKNSTIANNGGGGNCFGEGSSAVNSIVANCAGGATVTSLGHNLSSDDTCNFDHPTDQPNTDPMLGPLQDNGGPTPTRAPLRGSPVIDTGWCDPGTDQRGVPRPIDGNRDGVWICDIGSVEYFPGQPIGEPGDWDIIIKPD